MTIVRLGSSRVDSGFYGRIHPCWGSASSPRLGAFQAQIVYILCYTAHVVAGRFWNLVLFRVAASRGGCQAEGLCALRQCQRSHATGVELPLLAIAIGRTLQRLDDIQVASV